MLTLLKVDPSQTEPVSLQTCPIFEKTLEMVSEDTNNSKQARITMKSHNIFSHHHPTGLPHKDLYPILSFT